MHQFSIIIILILSFFLALELPVQATIKGIVEYSIPIDYSKLSEAELEEKAKNYYYNATKYPDGKINEDITNALFLYNVLQKINPKSIEYAIKRGSLYDKLNKDRQAKGCFSMAIGIDNTRPEPYFYLGEFYYKRELYRRALKYYNEAYKRGYEINYDLLFKIGDIYEKFGDTQSALKHLNDAKLQNPNPELETKIERIKIQDSVNKEFYSDTRIREFE